MGSYIPLVVDCDGLKISLPKQIAQAFGNYYSLYTLLATFLSQSHLDDYLSSARLPRRSSLLQCDLKAPITIDELHAAVCPTKLGKSAGLGGFTMQYYKVLLLLLGPHMVKMFNALGQSSFAPAMFLAHISDINKEGKDPSFCGSYGPILLLNVDLKLFTKLLASHLHLP